MLKRKIEYKWVPSSFYGLPAHIDASVLNLPFDERFDTTKLLDFTGTAVKDGGRIVFEMLFQGIDNLHDYEKMATTLGRPEIPVHEAARWVTDVEFGRQMLNGVNPVVIEKCTARPPNFPVTNDMVKGFLNRGLTLEQEMKVSLELVELAIINSGTSHNRLSKIRTASIQRTNNVPPIDFP